MDNIITNNVSVKTRKTLGAHTERVCEAFRLPYHDAIVIVVISYHRDGVQLR